MIGRDDIGERAEAIAHQRRDVRVNEQAAVLPEVSVAVQVTVVVPTGKVEADTGLQFDMTPGQLSLAEAE